MKRKLFRQKPTADFPARGWFFFSNNFVLDKFKVIHNFFFKSWQLAYFVFYSFVISRSFQVFSMNTRPSVYYAKDWLDQKFVIACDINILWRWPRVVRSCQVWKRFLTYGCDHEGAVHSHFLCMRPFSGWWQRNTWTPTQPGDPRASLLLTTEKAVYCTLVKGLV